MNNNELHDHCGQDQHTSHGDHAGHDHSAGDSHEHGHSIYGELVCHLPYAIFASAFALAILSFISVGHTNVKQLCATAHGLFHSFHFMHIVFAATGTLITFFRFSHRNAPISKTRAFVVGVISPAVFCTLSDAIIPYFSGMIMGVPMQFHLCFLTEWRNILPFLVVGLINGVILSGHHEGRRALYSLFSHSVHILVSALASLFYLVAYGCTDWLDSIGMVFLFLIIAVVVPCSLSDIVVPMMLAENTKKR
ncbi:MAG: hypothetical protein NT124_01095 [Candidatus Dependentiae bacterium]|jgi:hypothetical protein|nr:hypothetical protein [Candidatus Dependentiae bacterium]